MQPDDAACAIYDGKRHSGGSRNRFPCALSAQLLGSPSDSALGQIIGRHLDGHLVSRHDANVVHPQLTGNVCQNGVLVLQLHLKHCIRQRFENDAFYLNDILFDKLITSPMGIFGAYESLLTRLILFQQISELFVRHAVQCDALVRPLEMAEILPLGRRQPAPLSVCDLGIAAVHRQYHENPPISRPASARTTRPLVISIRKPPLRSG